jgi:hypothetical protein
MIKAEIKNEEVKAAKVEVKEEVIYTAKEVAEIGEVINGLKAIPVVDYANKRKVKESIPTLILSEIEKSGNAGVTLKAIENSLFKSGKKAVKEKRAEIESKGKDFRTFLKGRITAVKRYYLSANTVAEIGNALVFTGGKLYLTYRYFRVKD